MKRFGGVTLLLPLVLLFSCQTVPLGSRASSTDQEPALRPNAGKVTTLPIDQNYLVDLAVDRQGTLYLAALDGIYKVPSDGTLKRIAVVKNEIAFPDVDPTKTISNPRAITVDAGGTVYVATNAATFKIAPDGKQTTLPSFREAAVRPTGGWPSGGIAVDRKGNVYLTSTDDVIYKVSADGQVQVFAGQYFDPPNDGQTHLAGSGYIDGPALEARFRMPEDLAIDAQDDLYVADRNNSAIRMITPDGMVSTVVGVGREVLIPPSPAPGTPTPDWAELFKGSIPASCLAIDSAGTLYVGGGDNRIRRVLPSQGPSEWLGDGTLCPVRIGFLAVGRAAASPPTCFQDGGGTAARFDTPKAIGVDGTGRVYVLDGGPTFDDLRIRRIE